MKKHLGIFLLFALTAPLAGAYAWLHYEKRQLRREIRERMIAGMGRSELVLIKLDRQEAETALRWEHEREFEYRGHMYDIVEHKIQNDSLLYWCWPDIAETALNKKLDKLLSGALKKDPQRRAAEQQFVQFFKSLYFTEFYLRHIIFYPEYAVQPAAEYFFCSCFYKAPHAPPPEMA